MHTSDKSPSRASRLRLVRRNGVAALVGLACLATLRDWARRPAGAAAVTASLDGVGASSRGDGSTERLGLLP